MADVQVSRDNSGATNPVPTVQDKRPSSKFECISATDKNFLPLLGRGTDALNLIEWRKQAIIYPGLLVRQVEDDFSNIHGYTIGEERTYTVFDPTNSKDYSVSGNITAGGAAAGVPVSASLKTSTSRSRKENMSLTKHVIVNRMYAFKAEFPTSFPTALEKDLYKWIAERQDFKYKPKDSPDGRTKWHQHSLKKYTPEDIPVKKVEDYVATLTEDSDEWKEIEACIEEYIAKNKVTNYVFSIALGVKDTESSHSTEKRTEVSGGSSVGTTQNASVGISVLSNESRRERKTIGRVKVAEATGDFSVQTVGVVKVGIGGISDLIHSVKIRDMVERKAKEYKTRKRYPRFVISCKIRDPERVFFWQVKADGLVGVTTDAKEASHFYIEDKGKGQFCIYYYGDVSPLHHQYRDWHSKRLYFRRSKLPNTEIRVAESSWEYDDIHDLLFGIATRFSDLGPCSVDDWHKDKKMVYLTVSNGRFLCCGKTFYIQMNHNAEKSSFTLSFVDASGISHSSSLLFFCVEPTTEVETPTKVEAYTDFPRHKL